MKKFLMIIILGSYLSLLQPIIIRLDNDVIIPKEDFLLLQKYSKYIQDYLALLKSTVSNVPIKNYEFDFSTAKNSKQNKFLVNLLNENNGFFLKKIIEGLKEIDNSKITIDTSSPEKTKKLSGILNSNYIPSTKEYDWDAIRKLFLLALLLEIPILEKIWFTKIIDILFPSEKTALNQLLIQYKQENSSDKKPLHHLIMTLDKIKKTEIKEKIRSKLTENGFTPESNDNLLTQYFDKAAAEQKPSIESSSWSSWIRQHFKKLLSVLGVAGVAALIYKLSKRGAQHTPSPTPQ